MIRFRRRAERNLIIEGQVCPGPQELFGMFAAPRHGFPQLGRCTGLPIRQIDADKFAATIMPLLHFGSESQRSRFLPILTKGGVVTAIAISEPQAGSGVSSMTTRAVRDGDDYVINGRKQWRSYGCIADYIMLMAGRASSARDPGRMAERDQRR